MSTEDPKGIRRGYWFVGAVWDGTDDQTSRFVQEGLWENGYDDKYLDDVRAMQPGDRIAIKSTYTRKGGLPFDNRGEPVSVMAIKATGTVTENSGDGKTVRVDWSDGEDPPREWYFTTYWKTVHRVTAASDWKTDGLIGFAFEGQRQDLERFLHDPRWRHRYRAEGEERRFGWTSCYQAIADRLLDYRNNRQPLIERVHDIATRAVPMSILQDRFSDGSTGPLADICPFTTMATFNRGMIDENRQAVAKEIVEFLGIDMPAPGSFPGIPVVNNQRTWFFLYSENRGDGDIDALWRVFAAALGFAHADTPESRAELVEAYDEALTVKGVRWNLSMGLYWVRPWDFVPLDQMSRRYISQELRMDVPTTGSKPVGGASYLEFLDELKTRFEGDRFPVHSFPELSLSAWNLGSGSEPPNEEPADSVNGDTDLTQDEAEGDAAEGYSVTDVVNDGCFLERAGIERLLERLRTRKNLILQGPPGTGKTWLSKRLAFALMRKRDESRVRAVQFHPNLSYEDFVRGWRPIGEGKLALADGVFMEAIQAASRSPDETFVVVIEEINRGNPAQIFGELLTLLEADKRTQRDSVELCYPDKDGNRATHIPENLHVIGTMNIADRSLALVDLALRRRFAFVTLEPSLGEAWGDWVVREGGVDPELVEDIRRRIAALNERIAADVRLGSQFRIGHSYVTPSKRLEPDGTRDWFIQVVETEIGPLLEEYWFDSAGDASQAVRHLLDGW